MWLGTAHVRHQISRTRREITTQTCQLWQPSSWKSAPADLGRMKEGSSSCVKAKRRRIKMRPKLRTWAAHPSPRGRTEHRVYRKGLTLYISGAAQTSSCCCWHQTGSVGPRNNDTAAAPTRFRWPKSHSDPMLSSSPRENFLFQGWNAALRHFPPTIAYMGGNLIFKDFAKMAWWGRKSQRHRGNRILKKSEHQGHDRFLSMLKARKFFVQLNWCKRQFKVLEVKQQKEKQNMKTL